MTVYMVERNLAGIGLDQLAAAQKAAITTARDMREQGSNIRYIRSIFVPGRGRCMCLFEAESPDPVRQLNDVARIPYEGIIEAYDLTPSSPDR
jgi:Protein of unknown function (DUF4242)